MNTRKAVIKATGLTYAYEDGFDAVRGVDFEVYEGEFLAILGHNGSGKSTLAKLMNALFLPTGGEICVGGIVAKNEDDAFRVREKCGMVFQNPDNQIVATIVEEDVAFGLENLGVPSAEIRRRVDAALKTVGMEEHALSAPHMLSGGQKQRVAIAGVLAMRPEIIVFDEATAMLDPSGRAEVMRVVRELNKTGGVTVIWITHFMEEAAQAERILVMDEGKIAMQGTPVEVFARVEEIRALGLDAPEMILLAEELRKRGVPAQNVMTVDEMVVELCRLKS
ncbi:MAG TPA: energy-coupling factor transporter ATPase [Candidatus Alectryocaccomicrobium excrementavium]|uniref:Energy-coupling factor transporter ATPase n=1 Tax=Candidatus Alectryocaccomicrobium excrementavium TaxID=2840668 RepID=A0A9D1FYD7_9FIRM|nr:energy-coupling factor transporter ATPase [Candidatus Alectryocaccomicrobium excrementavium]